MLGVYYVWNIWLSAVCLHPLELSLALLTVHFKGTLQH